VYTIRVEGHSSQPSLRIKALIEPGEDSMARISSEVRGAEPVNDFETLGFSI
jgi:hypothetical protein